MAQKRCTWNFFGPSYFEPAIAVLSTTQPCKLKGFYSCSLKCLRTNKEVDRYKYLVIQLVFHIGPFWHYRARLPILRGFFTRDRKNLQKRSQYNSTTTPTAKVFDSNMTLETCISPRFSLQRPLTIQVI